MRTLIIEDELAGQELLKQNIQEYFPEFKIVGIADNVDAAVKLINSLKPELVFIDIQIKGGTGFDVLKLIKEKSFEFIFITAHDNFVIPALRAKAIDYLLKPINKKEFVEAVKRVIDFKAEHDRNKSTLDGILSVYTSSGTEFIKMNEVVFLEADGAYTNIYLQNSKVLSTKNIGEYENALPVSFFRCHHSFIINTNQIKRFEKGRSGLLLMNNDHKIPVSQRKMKEFNARIN